VTGVIVILGLALVVLAAAGLVVGLLTSHQHTLGAGLNQDDPPQP